MSHWDSTGKFLIAYVTPTLGNGGAERHIALLCTYLDRNKYEPIVFCLKAGGSFAAVIQQSQVPVVILAGNRIVLALQEILRVCVSCGLFKQDGLFCKSINRLGIILAEFLSFLHLVVQIRKYQIDLVSVHWAHSLSGLLAAKLLNIPSIYTEHSIVNSDYYSSVEVKFLKKLVPLAQHVIAVSESTKQSIIERIDMQDDNVTVVGHAVEFEYMQDDASQQLGMGSLIAVIGNLGRRKGHYYFLQSANLLLERGCGVRFLIAGDGPQRSMLEDQSKRMEIDEYVQFMGAYRNDELPRILREVSIVVIPSVSEAFGIVALEAMACGKPIIASDVGGLSEVIRDGENGILVPPRDPEAIAAAMERLLENPDLCQRLGNAGLEFVSRHTPEDIAVQTEAIYKSVLISESDSCC
jgi:glycosyltransferase involved in cell wall biosynthesis